MDRLYLEFIPVIESFLFQIFHLFYLKFDSATFQKMGSPREKDHLKFGKLTFRYGVCSIGDADLQHNNSYEKTLFVIKADGCYLPPQVKMIQTLYAPDGSSAFHLIELHPLES